MNLHFFVNSVAFIAAVIRRAELKPGEFRVICANTAGNREKLGDTVEIASTSSTAKKFNFYTSTVFEGSDILDPDGYTIVVSDDSTTGRVIDISTSMKQIVGRIRDSKYKGQLFYICPFARKQDVSFSKYAEITLTELQKANKMAERVNALPVEQREWEIKRLKPGLNDTYISVEETRLEVDRNKYMLDLFDYKKRCELRISNTGMIATLEAQDYRVYRMNKEYHDSMLSLKLLTGKKVRKDFKKYFEEYVLLMAEREQRGEIAYQVAKIFHGIEDRLGVLEKDYPLVGEAYRKLGVEKVRQMNYRTSNIKRALDKLEKTPDGKRVIHYIKKRYPLPCTRTVKEWNNTLEEIYRDELNLTGVKAVSTDLGKWFELERRSVNNLDKSGKTIDVITLLRERTILDTGTGKEMTGGVKNDQEGEE